MKFQSVSITVQLLCIYDCAVTNFNVLRKFNEPMHSGFLTGLTEGTAVHCVPSQLSGNAEHLKNYRTFFHVSLFSKISKVHMHYF